MTAALQHDRRLVAWLSLAQLISWGSVFYLFALIMAPIERELGISRAQSSLAFSLALLAEGLLAYPVGRLIDRGHERVVMTAGSLLLGVCLLAHSAVTTLAGFYAVWMVLGLGMAATLYTPVFAVVTRRFPDDFRRAIITMTFLGGLASTVFIPLSAWLISQFGWRYALWVLAALHLLVCAPLHYFLLKNAPPRGGHAPLGPGQATHANDRQQPVSLQPVNQESAHLPAAAPTLRDHLTSAPYLLIGLFVVLMMAVTAALPAHMVSLLREHGMSEAWAIAIPASIGIIQVLGRMLMFFFEHRFDMHTANRLIPCLMPLGLMALLGASWWGGAQSGAHGGEGGGAALLVLLFVLLWGMGNGMLTIVKGTAMAQYVSRTHVASLNGALGIPLALARAAAPIGLGLMWSPQTGYTNGLWVMLGLSVASVIALGLAQRLARPAP
jgi:MFS family permease